MTSSEITLMLAIYSRLPMPNLFYFFTFDVVSTEMGAYLGHELPKQLRNRLQGVKISGTKCLCIFRAYMILFLRIPLSFMVTFQE